MCSESDNEYDENLFDDGFFKSILSFMNDDSEDLSCSSGYASEIFSLDHVVTSGYAGGTQHYGDPIYKKRNFSDRLYTSWSTSSAGLKPSTHESPPTIIPCKNYDELMTIREPPEIDVFNQDLISDFEPSLKDKNVMFAKLLKVSLLPELRSHPTKEAQNIKVGSVWSDRQIMPKLPRLNSSSTPSASTSNQLIFDRNKENFSLGTSKLKICKFCLKNGEPSVVYMGHFLKGSNGIITCPILRRYTCEICGATGSKSHTRKYCPQAQPVDAVPPFRRLTNGILTRSLNHK